VVYQFLFFDPRDHDVLRDVLRLGTKINGRIKETAYYYLGTVLNGTVSGLGIPDSAQLHGGSWVCSVYQDRSTGQVAKNKHPGVSDVSSEDATGPDQCAYGYRTSEMSASGSKGRVDHSSVRRAESSSMI
jgi:hypothetical protein